MGLIGLIRSISPILRVILGLGFMFILPWLWMIIFGLMMYGSMSSMSYSYYSDPNSIMGTAVILAILMYGGAAIFFILGIVMTISGIMDWWKAKQDT